MKKLIYTIIIPLTVICFALFTKWWYALPVDARDTLYWGFPFPYVGEGWHTSMSLQFFVGALLADFLLYFVCLLLVVFCVHRFMRITQPRKIVTQLLWTLALLIICGDILIIYSSNSVFQWKNPCEMEIVTSGYKWIWQTTPHPDYPLHRLKNR